MSNVKVNLGIFNWAPMISGQFFFRSENYVFFDLVSSKVYFAYIYSHTVILHAVDRCSLPARVIVNFYDGLCVVCSCPLVAFIHYGWISLTPRVLDLVNIFKFLHIYPLIQIYDYYMVYTCLLRAFLIYFILLLLYIWGYFHIFFLGSIASGVSIIVYIRCINSTRLDGRNTSLYKAAQFISSTNYSIQNYPF